MNGEVEKFIKNVEDYWLEIRRGSSKGANARQRANKNLVDQWAKDGQLLDILSPLLDHSSNAVKLAAAACLIHTDAKENCIAILRYLIENDLTLIASSASAVLRMNNIK
jgi:hypothetical protein